MFSLSAPCTLRLAIASPTFSPPMHSVTWPYSCSRARGSCPPLCLSASPGILPLLLLPGPRRRLPTSPMWSSVALCMQPRCRAAPILFYFTLLLVFLSLIFLSFLCTLGS